VGQDIHFVEYAQVGTTNWKEAKYSITTPNANLGDAIEVDLAEFLTHHPFSNDVQIRFAYATNDKTTSISWLKPAQTHDKTMNYLYTQCEDIACRSLAPMMDTPAIKFIYSALVRVPKEYNVFMSANKLTTTAYNATFTETTFSSPVKIQSYLIALAIGDLKN